MSALSVQQTRKHPGQRLDQDAHEEAYYEVDLFGGEEYVIVIGAGTDTGAYELSVRQIDEVDDEDEDDDNEEDVGEE